MRARDPQADGRAVPAALRRAVRPALHDRAGDQPVRPGPAAGRTAYGVVNRLIQLALAGEALPIYGDGTPAPRLHLHRRCRVGAHLACRSRRRATARVYNVGTGVGTRDDRHGAQPSSTIAGGGRIEHVPWPPLAAADRDRRFRRRRRRGSARELGWAPARLARGRAAADDRASTGRTWRRDARAARVSLYLAHAFMVGGAEEMVLNLVRHLPDRVRADGLLHQSGRADRRRNPQDRRAVSRARPESRHAPALARARDSSGICARHSPTSCTRSC